MKHRGRKSLAEIEAEALNKRLNRRDPRIVVDNPPYVPPKPPDDLPDEEKALWRGIAAQHRVDVASGMVLKIALQAHALSRKAHDLVAREGVCIPNRDGNPAVHPALGDPVPRRAADAS